MNQEPPDDFGIAPTNNPRIHVLWERRGNSVDLAIQVEPEPLTEIAFQLPPTAQTGRQSPWST